MGTVGVPVTDVTIDALTGRVEAFIFENLVLGDQARMPSPADSLIESGVVDSTGVLELIEFLEEEFGITVEDSETVPENLDTIDRIVAFVVRKRT